MRDASTAAGRAGDGARERSAGSERFWPQMPAIGTAVAQAQDWPQLKTDQNYIEEVRRPTSLAVDDPMAVFSLVFNSLPERVKIYPTENYFYFTFVHRGVPYNGNIRLDASDR
ncbi:MAG: hypothetical protein ACXWU8_04685, partial [Rhodoplanes sp.]